MATESKTAVVAAIIGNVAIAVIKFAAGAATGSSAMLSEGIHSVVDTGNGGLLFLGIKRSARPPSATHPFGYGKELYFWSLIVAISIFGIGGGMSIYEGILHIRHPNPLEDPMWNYIVLALAMVFESMSFTVAYRAFRSVKGDRRAISAIHHGKDPSLFTVLFEDTAALAGLVVAFVGVFLAHELDNPYFDGAASVVIGCILAVVAVWLAWESKGLLVGESADPALVDDIRMCAGDDPVVTGVGAVLTMHLGPEEVLLNLEVEFAPGTGAEEIHAAIHRIEDRITTRHPEVNRIFVEVESLRAVSADGARVEEGDGGTAAGAAAPAGGGTLGSEEPSGIDKRHPAPPA